MCAAFRSKFGAACSKHAVQTSQLPLSNGKIVSLGLSHGIVIVNCYAVECMVMDVWDYHDRSPLGYQGRTAMHPCDVKAIRFAGLLALGDVATASRRVQNTPPLFVQPQKQGGFMLSVAIYLARVLYCRGGM
jgi:hypothetical protein